MTETETESTTGTAETTTGTTGTTDTETTTTETEVETDDQQATDTKVLETEQTTETEVIESDDQQATDTDTMDAEDTAAAGAAEEVIPEQEPNEVLASSLMGADVRLADESIGSVSDIIFDDKQIKGVVVGVGGFLGIGEKRVALPWEQISVQPAEEAGEVVLSANTTREELEASEEFKTASDVEAEEEAAQAEQQAGSDQPAPVTTEPATEPAN
jgi:hypothetical protein